MLKQAPPDRFKEQLRILDWVASPFGSQEDLLLTTGVQGRDYSIGADGNPDSNRVQQHGCQLGAVEVPHPAPAGGLLAGHP